MLIGAGVSFAQESVNSASVPHKGVIALKGKWVIDVDGKPMLNPQSSGLKALGGFLYTVSDGSADDSQVRRLHQLDYEGQIIKKFGPTAFNEFVKTSCFYSYLAGKPDYEGLVPLNNQGSEWIYVTEDARNGVQLSPDCQKKYSETNSTVYPTLLVRLELKGNALIVTGVRPIQFPSEADVGDQANDGIEGLAMTKDNRLLLGLEQNRFNKPKVFEVSINDGFWQTLEFARVNLMPLKLPDYGEIDHPINGMDVFYPNQSENGFLLAAARNQDELWVIDLQGKNDTKVIPIKFFAPSFITNEKEQCIPFHEMDNASIEGIAVRDQTVFLINDPWKVNYEKNVVCELDRSAYQRFSPLLFEMEIQNSWFD